MTSISQVKTALQTALAAALPASQVIYGPVASVSALASRVVEVGSDDTPGTLHVDFNGKVSRREYQLKVTVSVSLATSDMKTAEDQAEADHAVALATISANKKLGFSDVSCRTDGTFVMKLTANKDGRAAAVEFPVMVVNTI